MEKQFIHNRKNQKLAVTIEGKEGGVGLVFIMHGLGGFKEQKHLQAMTEVFLDNHYVVVRFDTTNTFGESDGDYSDATTTNYYEDLEDVISWALGQTWYSEPFILVGHSIGGLCTALYAEAFPHKVKGLAPISSVVSGELSVQTKKANGELDEWQRTGWRVTMSESKPGLVKKLKWSHMEDRMKYDILREVDKLTMPTLLIVGDEDDSTPPDQQKMLYNLLPGRKELHVIKEGPHTFKTTAHLQEIKSIFTKWIKTL